MLDNVFLAYDLRRLVAAGRLAALQRNGAFTTEHLVRSLCTDRDVRRAIAAGQVAPDDGNLNQAKSTAETTVAPDVSADPRTVPDDAELVAWLLTHCGISVVPNVITIVTCLDVFVGLLKIEPAAVAAAIGVTGLDIFAVLWHVSHGHRQTWLRKYVVAYDSWRLRATLAAGQHHVLMHDDAHTSIDFVHEVLQRHFGHSEIRAAQLARDIAQAGAASIAVMPTIEAAAAIAATNQAARALHFPLRLSVTPPVGVPRAVGRDDGSSGGAG